MSSHNFFFIHNYKVLGTTIYSQLPESYNKLLYGHRTLNDIMEKNPGVQLNKINSFNENDKISIDHIHIDVIISLGLIKIPLNEITFMMIMRDPIERFISICNFHAKIKGETMENHISKLKNKIGDDYYQHKFIKNKNNIKVKLFKMNDKLGIIHFFEEFGININLNIKKNVSIKKYNISDISDEDLIFLKNFYKKDYELYNSI